MISIIIVTFIVHTQTNDYNILNSPLNSEKKPGTFQSLQALNKYQIPRDEMATSLNEHIDFNCHDDTLFLKIMIEKLADGYKKLPQRGKGLEKK